MTRRLTLQVTIRVRSEGQGRGLVVTLGSGLPRHFASVDEARTYVGSLGGDVRELDDWLRAGEAEAAGGG